MNYINRYQQQNIPLPHQKQFVTGMRWPTPKEMIEIKQRGVIAPVAKIVEVNDNGTTVEVATDANGEVVATKAQANIAPLAITAGLAWLFLM